MMKSFLSKVFLLLQLLLITTNSSMANAAQEQVLYANPQYYTPSEIAYLDETSTQSARTVGILFNIRSKLTNDDEIIYITGFDFYTHINGNVFYQLFSRKGEYYVTPEGKDGGLGIDDWDQLDPNDLISDGIAEAYGECMAISDDRHSSSSVFSPAEGLRQSTNADSCPLTVIPDSVFPAFNSDETLPFDYPWTLKGVNATRSFYLTLASTDLYVLPNTGPPKFDSNIVASTPDIDLYEGVASRTYPIDRNTAEYFMQQPVGFIGKIYYHVGIPGEILEEPVITDAPQVNAPLAPPTSTLTPSAAPNTLQPTAKPTRRCRPGRPCLTPPASPVSPTTSPSALEPASTTTIELMVYLENVPERQMSDREEREYVEVMLTFLQENENLMDHGVFAQNLTIFYHNVYDKQDMAKIGRLGRIPIQNNESGAYTYNYDMPSAFSSEYPTVYVMTNVDIITNGLPYDVAAFFIWDEFKDHELALIETFNANSLFVSYFRKLKGITVEVVDGATKPPTQVPTVSSPPTSEVIDIEGNEIQRQNLFIAVGICLGVLWCILTLIGFRQIYKQRRKAIEQSEMKKMRRQTQGHHHSQSKLTKGVSSRIRRISLWGNQDVNRRISMWASQPIGKPTQRPSLSRNKSVEEGLDGAEVMDADCGIDARVYYDHDQEDHNEESDGEEQDGEDTTTAADSGRTGQTSGMTSATSFFPSFL